MILVKILVVDDDAEFVQHTCRILRGHRQAALDQYEQRHARRDFSIGILGMTNPRKAIREVTRRDPAIRIVSLDIELKQVEPLLDGRQVHLCIENGQLEPPLVAILTGMTQVRRKKPTDYLKVNERLVAKEEIGHINLRAHAIATKGTPEVLTYLKWLIAEAVRIATNPRFRPRRPRPFPRKLRSALKAGLSRVKVDEVLMESLPSSLRNSKRILLLPGLRAAGKTHFVKTIDRIVRGALDNKIQSGALQERAVVEQLLEATPPELRALRGPLIRQQRWDTIHVIPFVANRPRRRGEAVDPYEMPLMGHYDAGEIPALYGNLPAVLEASREQAVYRIWQVEVVRAHQVAELMAKLLGIPVWMIFTAHLFVPIVLKPYFVNCTSVCMTPFLAARPEHALRILNQRRKKRGNETDELDLTLTELLHRLTPDLIADGTFDAFAEQMEGTPRRLLQYMGLEDLGDKVQNQYP